MLHATKGREPTKARSPWALRLLASLLWMPVALQGNGGSAGLTPHVLNEHDPGALDTAPRAAHPLPSASTPRRSEQVSASHRTHQGGGGRSALKVSLADEGTAAQGLSKHFRTKR